MKYIITGAGGFVGGALCKKLLEEGHEVYALDVSIELMNKLKDYKNVHLIKAEFSDYKELDLKTENFDIFYHMAWAGICGPILKDYRMQSNNIAYACDALMLAVRHKTRKFILCGSINELEAQNYIGAINITPRYTTLYGTSKLAASLMCKTLAYQNNIEYNEGMNAMLYGENNASRTIPNIVMKQLLTGVTPKLIDGDNLYDILYIDDVVDAFIAIGQKGINQKTYYVGNRKIRTIREIIENIRDVINPKADLLFGAYPESNGVDFSKINTNELFEDTGFEPKVNFNESIKRTVKWVEKLDL